MATRTMIGTRIGKFVIKGKLGEGGMGAIYAAEHEILRKRYAIKLLLPQWTQSEMLVQRFINEALAVAALRHRNIIQVHDCGHLPDGSWYIVMDYLEGATLARFGGSYGGPMPPHLALQILAPIANGLETAHRAGIVHRDLKPENIFLIQHEQNPHYPIIIDWGIAKLGERDGGAITRTGMMAGTPAYMAPEQMRDLKLVDARSDVYALGVITYQMVTGGYLPYQEEATLDEFNQLSAAEIYHRQMSRPPIDPRERFAGISERWASTIRAAIEPDPARRHPSPRAFVLKLAEATEGDDFKASGTDIVRAYAKELLEIGNLLETVRAPKPAVSMAPVRSRYRLGERLGTGGMAEVFRGTMNAAEGVVLPVAVKRVLPGLSTPQFVSMFVQEAQLASLLKHPNIVTILDFDRDPDGCLFLVMEYVEGRDLASLAGTGLLPFSTVNFILSELLCGLGYAHAPPIAGPVRGLVHRDVSPHNVLLSWEGAVKVSDFGIAKAREASAATASTLIKGKVAYMSPEQANGEPLDGRSDLFAVGIMAWELLTGRALFGDGTARETLAKVIFGPIPRPSTIRPEVPADLEAVTMRLLERDKAARYANAELAVDALANCADAPRGGSGRRDLARLLAARFPEAVAVRSSPPQLGDGMLPVNASPSQQDRVTVRDSRRHEPQLGAPEEPWRSSETTFGTAASQSVHRSKRSARWPWLVASGLVLLGTAAGTLALAVATRDSAQPSPTATTPSRQEVAAGSATLRDSKSVRPTLTVVTEPSGAAVRIDGSPRGKSPLTIPVESGHRVLIEAEHDGFESDKQTITADREAQTVTLSLIARSTTTPIPTTHPTSSMVRPARQPATGLPDARPAMRPKRDIKSSNQMEAPLRPSGRFNEDDVRGD